MIHLDEIEIVAIGDRGEEKVLHPVRDYLEDGIQSFRLYDRKRHVEGSLHAVEADSLTYLYVNIEHPVKKIQYRFARRKGECLFLTYQLQAYISNQMYFVHINSKDDLLEINTAGQTYVSVTTSEDAEVVIGTAPASDRLLQLLTKVVNSPERRLSEEAVRQTVRRLKENNEAV